MENKHNARFISPEPAVLAAEIETINPHPTGQWIMRRKAEFFAIRVSHVGSPDVQILKQELLSRGGEVATHRDSLPNQIAESDALLLCTRSQLENLIPKLRMQEGGLPGLADELEELLATLGQPLRPVQIGPYALPLGQRTLIMGILNMTPDSFSGDGLYLDADAALRQAAQMKADGADILDVGGMSTRPGSEPVSEQEELDRVLPIIRRIRADVDLPISIDTYRASVADAALGAGAVIVNDITGLRGEPEIARVVARHNAGLIVMHIQGTPRNMQVNPHYDDLLGEVIEYLREARDRALEAGIRRELIMVDPGIGFGKTLDHNLDLLHRLGELRSLGQPILLGTSRKGFIGRVLGGAPPEERVVGTGATVALAIAQGVSIVRVHDVKVASDIVRVSDAIVRR